MTLEEIRRLSTAEIEHELRHIDEAYRTAETPRETHYLERSERNLRRVLAERRDGKTGAPRAGRGTFL